MEMGAEQNLHESEIFLFLLNPHGLRIKFSNGHKNTLYYSAFVQWKGLVTSMAFQWLDNF